MGRGRTLLLRTLLASSLAAAGPVLGATWWVSPDGDDASGTGSESAPFRTVAHAAAAAASGDTVRVLPGAYFECVDASAKALAVLADAIEEDSNDRVRTILDGTGICGGSTCEDRLGLACYGDGEEQCAGTCIATVCSTTQTTYCTEDADCPEGETCTGTAIAGICSNDGAAGCAVDECVIPEDETVGACRDHPNVECTENANCADLGCDFGACVRIGGLCGGAGGAWCAADGDCAEGTACEPFPSVPVIALGSGSSIEGFTVRGGGSSGVRLEGSGAIVNNWIAANRAGSGSGGGIAILPAASPAPVRCFADSALACEVDSDCVVCRDDPTVRCRDLRDCHDAGLEGPCAVLGPCLEVTEATVSDNSVLDNAADAGKGGGIHALAATGPGTGTRLVSRGNTVSGNAAAGDGGGLAIESSGAGWLAIEIDGNTVEENEGHDGGGLAISVDDGGGGGSAFVRVSDGTFGGNEADASGGGLSVDLAAGAAARLALTGSQVRANAAGGDGGGARLTVAGGAGSALEALGNSLSANEAMGSGGALDLDLGLGLAAPGDAGSLAVEGNEIVGNGAGVGGGGLRAIARSAPGAPAAAVLLSGNEVRGNVAGSHGGGFELRAVSDAPAGIAASFLRNLVADNAAEDEEAGAATGGALFVFLGGTDGTVSLDADFSTLASNRSDAGAAGVEIESDTSAPAAARVAIRNSVLSENVGTAIGGPLPFEAGKVMSGTGRDLEVRVAWNDVYTDGWEDFERTIADETIVEDGNVFGDPVLLPGFTLDLCSAALDAADPERDFSGEPQPNGLRANAGHLGGTNGATPTPPDVDRDGEVDGRDLVRLATAFASSAARTPARYDPAADIDGNGVVDGDDVAYVAAFFGFSCP